LKLGWKLEVQVAVGASVYLTTESEVTLSKPYYRPGSHILEDATGLLAVRDDEPMTGACRYSTTTQLRTSRGAVLALGGVRLESDSDTIRGLEVSVDGETFDVQRGWTLGSVEALCFEQFSAEVRASVAREVELAMRSRVEILQHGDDRVEGLRSLLEGNAVEVTHRGYRWYAAPMETELDGDAIVVHGTLTRIAWWRDHDYSFDFRSDRDRLSVESSSISPRGTDAASKAALSLAAFFARNAAARYAAASDGKPLVVDTSLLDAL
jgi:hypothetical protein